MPTVTDPQLLTFKNWIFRLRLAKPTPGRLLVLIHGWMGDENSMWVFTRNLSPDYAILGPRGPFAVTEGGYSWREVGPGTWGMSPLEDLRPAADALLAFVDDWAASARMDVNQFDLMGFSQGAAMTYTLAFLYPERVRKLAALSGFIPEHGEALLASQRFSGKAVFVSHGRKDELIPVEQARKAVAQLERAGAQVTYCESDGGHKVGKECLKEMDMFFEKY
jgi:phospholipase/carboxylesterase